MRVLSTPVPVSAPPTGLDECLFFISLVYDFLAIRFSVNSGYTRRRSVSTYAAILVLMNTLLCHLQLGKNNPGQRQRRLALSKSMKSYTFALYATSSHFSPSFPDSGFFVFPITACLCVLTHPSLVPGD